METNDVQKMRGALNDLANAAMKVVVLRGHDGEDLRTLGYYMDLANYILGTTKLRQCDVGTAEEQAKRWEQFCIEHHEPWKPGVPAIIQNICKCPCFSMNQCNMFIWAKMPYEEGCKDHVAQA